MIAVLGSLHSHMSFDLAFDLQRQIQGQRTVYRISSQNDGSTRTKMIANDSIYQVQRYGCAVVQSSQKGQMSPETILVHVLTYFGMISDTPTFDLEFNLHG